MKITRALISVSDKTGLEGLVKKLDSLGVEILSTGGTAKFISSLGVSVIDVSDYTDFPEMLDGRLKTLHPKIHGGLLAKRENADHMREIEEAGILPIDMVVVNLYPFEETISKKGVTFEEAIENIDIGGPTMLRSAAKNLSSVAVVSDPSQYDGVIAELESSKGELSAQVLKELAAQVFTKTARYDSIISAYLAEGTEAESASDEELPDNVNITLKKEKALRYGENPHQRAAFYRDPAEGKTAITEAEQLQGKELSFNNILDLSSAIDIVSGFDGPAVSIVKHNNPCGAALAKTLEEAYLDALDTDRMSAFGSIMGFNGPITGKLAGTILGEVDFVECIIAPDYDEEALQVFSAKKNLRILKVPEELIRQRTGLDIKKISGGALVQDADTLGIKKEDLKIVTKAKPEGALLEALIFGWRIVKFVKSNAIVLTQGTKTVGIGAGQMSRVDSVIIAVRKAGEKAKGACLASDAFFPKADSIEQAHEAGIAAIIQPGGSIRDEEVIKACDDFGISMIFTGRRHFRH